VGGTRYTLAGRSFSLSPNTYNLIGLSWKGNTLKAYLDRQVVLTATDTTFTSFTYVFVSTDCRDKYFDWVFVRKFTDPEPTYSFGTEQINLRIKITNKRINEYVSLVNVTYEISSGADSNVTLEFYLNNNLVDTGEYFIQAFQTIYDYYVYTIEKEGNYTIKLLQTSQLIIM
jgi:hypothetical protein